MKTVDNRERDIAGDFDEHSDVNSRIDNEHHGAMQTRAPFSFKDAAAVRPIATVNSLILDPSLIWEDALCYHDETLRFYPAVHDKIGIQNCSSSAQTLGRCKDSFKSQFSYKLIDEHSSVTGRNNEYGEPYWRGEDAYRIEKAEDLFYASYELIKC